MLTIGYFFVSFGIFLLFTFLITLLGYFFQYHLFSSFKLKKISLTIILESFGIGTALFIFYSYFIIDFLKSFTFFTIYLPLLIFDIINLLYFLHKNDYFSHDVLSNSITRFQKLLSNKRIRHHITILVIIFLLLLLVQGVIETHLNYPARDPYTWFEITLYLHKYGDLNYDNYTVHGVGFAIFAAGSLLITGNFYIQYFYLKYISTFFLSIIILAVYNMASWFFKRDFEILVTLMVLLSFNSLLFRFSLLVPSIIATTLGVIFFNTLIQEENKRILLIRGMLLGGMFLTHPLYFLFLFGYMILFELLILINKIKENLKSRDYKNSRILFKFIERNSILILIPLIFAIPYFLNLLFSGKSLYKNFTRYLFRGYETNINNLLTTFSKTHLFEITLISFKPSTSNFLYNLLFLGFDIPINKTLNWGVIFIILGLIYNTKGENPQKKYLIEFTKFSLLLSFITFIISSLFFVIDNSTILSFTSFIYQYGIRVFELFSPLWAILFVLGVSTIFNFLKKKKTENSKGDKESQEKKYEKFYLVIILVLGASIYSSHLYFQYNIIYTSHYDDDYLTEALLFMGDYFNTEDLEDKTVLFPDNDKNFIYSLIYHRDFEKEYLEFDNTDYIELLNATLEENADYVLVYKLETEDSCLDKIDDEQKVLYENPNYLFFKVK